MHAPRSCFIRSRPALRQHTHNRRHTHSHTYALARDHARYSGVLLPSLKSWASESIYFCPLGPRDAGKPSLAGNILCLLAPLISLPVLSLQWVLGLGRRNGSSSLLCNEGLVCTTTTFHNFFHDSKVSVWLCFPDYSVQEKRSHDCRIAAMRRFKQKTFVVRCFPKFCISRKRRRLLLPVADDAISPR